MNPKKKKPYEAILIGQQIRFIRRSKDISQKTLATNLHVRKTVAWIGRIERGEHIPSIRLLYNIAQALQVKLRDLIPAEL